jgi:hypothetical protein
MLSSAFFILSLPSYLSSFHVLLNLILFLPFFFPCLSQLSSLIGFHHYIFLTVILSLPSHLSSFHAFLCFLLSQPSTLLFFPCLTQLSATLPWPTSQPFYLPSLPLLSPFSAFHTFIFHTFLIFLLSILGFYHVSLSSMFSSAFFFPSHPHFFLSMPFSAFCCPSLHTNHSTFHAFICRLLPKHSCSPFYLTCLHLPPAPQAFMLTILPYMPSSAACSPSIHAHLSTFHAFICRLLPKHSCSPFYLTCLHLPSVPQAFVLTFLPYMPSSAVCSPRIHSHLSTLPDFICRLLPKHSCSPFYLTCLHLPCAPLAFILTFLPYMPSSVVCTHSIHSHLSTFQAFICRLLP